MSAGRRGLPAPAGEPHTDAARAPHRAGAAAQMGTKPEPSAPVAAGFWTEPCRLSETCLRYCPATHTPRGSAAAERSREATRPATAPGPPAYRRPLTRVTDGTRLTHPPRRGPPTSPPEGVGVVTAETSQTLDRGLRVLKLLADTDHGQPVTELSHKLGVNRTVVYRLLATLEQHALVRRDLGGRARDGLGVLGWPAGAPPGPRGRVAGAARTGGRHRGDGPPHAGGRRRSPRRRRRRTHLDRLPRHLPRLATPWSGAPPARPSSPPAGPRSPPARPRTAPATPSPTASWKPGPAARRRPCSASRASRAASAWSCWPTSSRNGSASA
ncbi:hypothetical protein LSPH24S_00373 [Lysinibacillus sphaericus]